MNKKLMFVLLSIFVLAALFNLQLRETRESDISLYRFLFPFHVVFLSLLSVRLLKNYSIYVALISFITLISVGFSQYEFSLINISFYIHYLTIGTFFLTGVAWVAKLGDESFEKMLFYIICLVVFFSFLEFFLAIHLPNVEFREGRIRAFFTNENDLSLVALVISMYFMVKSKRGFLIVFSYVFSAGIAIYNSSVICIVGVCSLPFVIYLSGILSKVSALTLLGFVGLGVCFFYLLVFSGALDSQGIVYRIAILEPFAYEDAVGSIKVRANLLVWSVYSLVDSWFLGVGPGNSISMIESRTYGDFHGTANSLHNFPFQVITELGVLFFIVSGYIFLNLSSRLLILIGFMLFVSLSQSAGLFSNVVFFIIMGAMYESFRSKVVR